MKKSKLKAKIKKLRAQVLEARTSAVASSMAKLIVGGMIGGKVTNLGTIAVPRKPEAGEPEIIGALRRAAMEARAKGETP